MASSTSSACPGGACPVGGNCAAPPKPWERGFGGGAIAAPGVAPATGVAATSGVAGASTTATASSSTAYGGAYGASTYSRYGGYGGVGSPYGGAGYGGYSGYGGLGGGLYGGGGMYGGGMYGGGMYRGGMMGRELDPSKDFMPPGMRQLEDWLLVFGRITQALEMNFEVRRAPRARPPAAPRSPRRAAAPLAPRAAQRANPHGPPPQMLHHFLAAVGALAERARAMYTEAANLTTAVGRRSLEFGESSLPIARELSERASSQFRRRRKLACLALVGFCLALLRRHYRRPRRVAHGGAALGAALASAALDGAWR